ncbi:hypothetical protein JD292_05735 [Leucobacter sp. CSA2]|uniref:Uncharacterized protein n=1 Tax=Leucobacter edaphi TaxID=2796472 RepID=A0A934QE24_9MICO|nr:hypothetical protein [Leucobacter edaphi]MBK0421569.1 hypothetical protein [Leucobacter edaphi]
MHNNVPTSFPERSGGDGFPPTPRRRHTWAIWVAAAAGTLVLLLAASAALILFIKLSGEIRHAHKLTLLNREYEFGELADACGINSLGYSVQDDGESIRFDDAAKFEPNRASASEIECFASSIGAPDSLEFKIGNTRAVDGTLNERWKDHQATWTYHPESGLNIVFERTDSPPTLAEFLRGER